MNLKQLWHPQPPGITQMFRGSKAVTETKDMKQGAANHLMITEFVSLLYLQKLHISLCGLQN